MYSLKNLKSIEGSVLFETETFTMIVTHFFLVWMAASLWPSLCMANKEENVAAYEKYREQSITIVIVFVVIFFCLALVVFLTGLCCSNCSMTTRTISDQETGLTVTCPALNYSTVILYSGDGCPGRL